MAIKASIIIATKDRAKLLEERSLRSALKQTFKDYEVIVVDDAGTDNTQEVMAQYPQVRYYRLFVNRGLSYVRNFGVKKARGKYVVCLDDDNELLPSFLEKTVALLDEDYFDAVTGKRIIQYKEFADCVEPGVGKFMSIDWGWLIKKEVFYDIEYDEAMRANEDTDFGIHFVKLGYEAVVIPEPLTIAYDTEKPEESLSFPTKRELYGMDYFFRKNFGKYDDPVEKWHLYKLMGRKFYRGGKRVQGLHYFWLGFLAWPDLRSFLHLFFILFGWKIYDRYMSFEERLAANRRKLYDNR